METVRCQVVRNNRLRKGYIRLFDNWKRIRCKPTSPYKLWKFQSESFAKGGRICKRGGEGGFTKVWFLVCVVVPVYPGQELRIRLFSFFTRKKKRWFSFLHPTPSVIAVRTTMSTVVCRFGSLYWHGVFLGCWASSADVQSNQAHPPP